MTDALIVGCGSIGERHVGNLVDLDVNVTACDVDTDRTAAVADKYNVDTKTDYERALNASPDCVLVCTPPTAHIDIAIDALNAGADVFVEKPVAPSVEDAAPLVEATRSTEGVVYVACNMRFHPPVRQLNEWIQQGVLGSVEFLRLRYGYALENWRGGNYQEYYSASGDGGGVILDAIHELDIADHWLNGTEEVVSVAENLSSLDIDAEDTAEILLRGDGRLAEVHLDYVRPIRARTYEIIGSDGMARWHAEGKNPETSRVTLSDADGDCLAEQTFESTLNEMYVAEMEHFLDCVTGDANPPVDPARGSHLVRIAAAAKAASEERRVERLQ